MEAYRDPTEIEHPVPPHRLALRIAIGCFLLTLVAQLIAPFTDNQGANLGTAVFGILGLLIGWIAWVRNSPSWIVAFIPVFIFGGLVVVGSCFFRFVGFSGELVPHFNWRFSPFVELPEMDEPSPTDARKESPEHDNLEQSRGLPIESGFPEFLGPGRRAFLPKRDFSDDWVANPPEVLWKQAIGPGWSGFAIRGEQAITMEQRGGEEWTTCYRITDGKMLWRYAFAAYHYHALGGEGPRATPTIFGDRVYAQGATGILVCLTLNGELIWQLDLLSLIGQSQLEAESGVSWGRSGSPLVFQNQVVVPLGGGDEQATSLIALDAATGEELWREGDDQISYASPLLATVAGRQQILSVNESTASGHDPETGRKLWEYTWEGKSNGGASVSQPMPVGDDRILLSKGYGGGGAIIRLVASKNGLTPELVWHFSNVLKTKFTNTVIIGEHGYALSDGTLECVDLQEGKSLWKQPRRGRYGQGQLIGVEDMLIVLSEDGEVALVKAQSDAYEELARIPVLSGTTWNTLALSDRYLLIRNSQEAACLRLPVKEVNEK